MKPRFEGFLKPSGHTIFQRFTIMMFGQSDDDPLGGSGSILILKVEEKQNGRFIYPSFPMTKR